MTKLLLLLSILFSFCFEYSSPCAAAPAPVPIPFLPAIPPIVIIDKKKCLHPDTSILVKGGHFKKARDLQKGDKLLSFRNGNLEETTLIWHQKADQNKVRQYLSVTTSRGNRFTVTPEHVIFCGECGAQSWATLPAERLSLGDCVPSLRGDARFHDDKVTEVRSFYGNEGVYESITTSGSLIAGNVSISTFDEHVLTNRQMDWSRKLYEQTKTKLTGIIAKFMN